VGGLDQLRHQLIHAGDAVRWCDRIARLSVMKRTRTGLLVISTIAALGCDRPAEAHPAPDGEKVEEGAAMIVDSILPSDVALQRFQSELIPVRGLSSGIRSRDELVTRFVRAIESGDTATLETLLVSKAEYGFLYFPTSTYSRKPYELPPGIAWLLSEQNSQKGLTRVTRRLGGKKLNYAGYECSSTVTEGENRFWRTCLVRYSDPSSGQPVSKRLFGAIMEHAGRYKFLSYANDL
jgi:hypothetical protein